MKTKVRSCDGERAILSLLRFGLFMLRRRIFAFAFTCIFALKGESQSSPIGAPYLNKELTDIFSPPYQNLTQYNCALIDNIFNAMIPCVLMLSFCKHFIMKIMKRKYINSIYDILLISLTGS